MTAVRWLRAVRAVAACVTVAGLLASLWYAYALANPIESAVLIVCSTPHDFACAGPKAHEALQLGIAPAVALLGLVPFIASSMALRRLTPPR